MSKLRSERRRQVVGGLSAALLLGSGVNHAAQAQARATQRPTDARLIAAAKKEGSLALYGASSVASLRADATAFEKAYGIPVTFTQMTSGPMAARVDQEIRAGRITSDIIISADTVTLYRWIAAGHIAKLPDVKFPQRNDHMAPIQVIFQGLFYNTRAVPDKDKPKTWADVVDPKYSGKIVLGSPRIGPAYAMQYFTLWKDPRYGEPWLQKLAALKPRVVQTPALVAQLTASGEASIGFNGIPYDATNIRTANPSAPINYTYMDIITQAQTFVVINARAQRPNAANLFAAWLMSPEGQSTHNGENRASSLLGDLPGTLTAPDPKLVRQDITVSRVAREYQDVISLFDRMFR